MTSTSPNASSGKWSFGRIVRKSGFHRQVVLSAVRRLGVPLYTNGRTGRGARRWLYAKHAHEVLRALVATSDKPASTSRWSARFSACLRCGTRKNSGADRHEAGGLCRRCSDARRARRR